MRGQARRRRGHRQAFLSSNTDDAPAPLFEHDLEIDGRSMNLLVPVDCGPASPAYGDATTSFARMKADSKGSRSPVIGVIVDGHPLRALVDTGAPASMIDVRVAHAPGIDPAEHNVGTIDVAGVGTHRMAVWLPRQFEHVQVGGERIRRPGLPSRTCSATPAPTLVRPRRAPCATRRT